MPLRGSLTGKRAVLPFRGRPEGRHKRPVTRRLERLRASGYDVRSSFSEASGASRRLFVAGTFAARSLKTQQRAKRRDLVRIVLLTERTYRVRQPCLVSFRGG